MQRALASLTRLSLAFALLGSACGQVSQHAAVQSPKPEPSPHAPSGPNNVIVMVADGFGFSALSTARPMLHPEPGSRFAFERLLHSGYQTTHSAEGHVTDSAAAASAWACGEKFQNRHLCLRANGTHPDSILDLAKQRGAATGLVVTATVTHATPAAFAAHAEERACENAIARQYMARANVDVLLGGGRERFEGSQADSCGDQPAGIQAVQAAGYQLVHTTSELEAAVQTDHRRLLGLFAPKHLTPNKQRAPDSTEPTLAAMTTSALSVLSRNPAGFFLMVEGSQVDMAAHGNAADYMLGEIAGFEAAVEAVRAWIDAVPERKQHTLLIVLADHETAVVTKIGGTEETREQGDQVAWLARAHVGTDVPIWSSGPLSDRLAGPSDNTDLYRVMLDALVAGTPPTVAGPEPGKVQAGPG